MHWQYPVDQAARGVRRHWLRNLRQGRISQSGGLDQGSRGLGHHPIINDAERRGQLKPGGVIVEGTAGNVGIGIALVANARGYRSVIVMPDTQSQEKKDMLRLSGADLRLIPAVPYSNPALPAIPVVCRRTAAELNGAFWANQFDNVANRDGHYRTTGPEISSGAKRGFTCASHWGT